MEEIKSQFIVDKNTHERFSHWIFQVGRTINNRKIILGNFICQFW